MQSASPQIDWQVRWRFLKRPRRSRALKKQRLSGPGNPPRVEAMSYNRGVRNPEETQAIQTFRQTVTVPETRELRIQLPHDASPREEAEVVVLFKSERPELSSKFEAMREAVNDELFLADLGEVMEDFRHADAVETPA